MKLSWPLALTVLLALFASGCGGDKDKDINRPDQKRDLPRAAPTETGKLGSQWGVSSKE
jgi:hypothetical protein